jgi:formylmethanofuran dehydrogenase subunit E
MGSSYPEDLAAIVEFHGHLCPGLLIGYRASKAGLARLGIERARDEELVAVVENDACGVDAVQYLTGATFGKGNLVFKDLGKHAFSFFSRDRGTSVRVVLRPEAIDDERRSKIKRQLSEASTPQERATAEEQLRAARERAIESLLAKPDDELFWFKETQGELPAPARVLPAIICDRCGEGVMESRVAMRQGECLCLTCAAEFDAEASTP